MVATSERAAGVGHLTLLPTAAVHFGPAHVLADVAARNCAAHRSPLAGPGACGACWERAIRDDERFAVECDLPRDLTPDPSYVDEIAVDLACQGQRVELTRVEFAAAVERLRGRSMSASAIASRLHASYHAVLCVIHPELIGAAA
ncbi:hypothetical protein ACFFX1_24180 [Dactylosporangium sucinum]|uniref:Uncharacterized protein n=1 Tax=Dactylosporangium sucinum TaxID=1424081 RepID=A0A917WZP8_9ACTN|nr:hypothetical protein [Dactylosporangium sucinum]GGM43966.1 hypothetical protein GCM10007977_051940 [Dactylosporangium sucinum]